MTDSRLLDWFTRLHRRNDVVMAIFLVMIVFMMILPMPTLLVDSLVALNMTLAVVLMMVGIYISTPLSFSAFPSVLLLTTLFRLALSITTTRLILLDGDAGAIIHTFGEFVVGGNIVVGLVVFFIITVVQFIVITKGSERVAEVSARFALDGMPGKQMSIDADLRAGSIDAAEARRRRRRLEDESKLFGSMDGAMKFIKGDAVAGIVIILVNIIGGIAVGALQRDMSVGEAGAMYTILTIGDGLVAQIPALFIAITSGIIVTRVGTAEKAANLGSEIGGQILAQPNALIIGGAVALLMALIPGFPGPVFVFLAVLSSGAGLVLMLLRRRLESQGRDFARAMADDEDAGDVNSLAIADQGMAVPLAVYLSPDLAEALPVAALCQSLNGVRRQLHDELGVPYPAVKLATGPQLPENRFQVIVDDVPAISQTLRLARELALQSARELSLARISAEPSDIEINAAETAWVDPADRPRLEEREIGVLTPRELICHQFMTVLRRQARAFIGTQETRQLLDRLKPDYGELVKEAEGNLPVPMIAAVLQRLVSENVSLRHLRLILDALVTFGKNQKEPSMLTDLIRIELAQQISHQYAGESGRVDVILLDQQWEQRIRQAIKRTDSGVYVDIDPQTARQLGEKTKEAVAGARNVGQLVVLTAQDVRRFVRILLEQAAVNLPVLGMRELTSAITIQPAARVTV